MTITLPVSQLRPSTCHRRSIHPYVWQNHYIAGQETGAFYRISRYARGSSGESEAVAGGGGGITLVRPSALYIF
jgi:hypothetical protein